MNYTSPDLEGKCGTCYKAQHYVEIERLGLPCPEWFYADGLGFDFEAAKDSIRKFPQRVMRIGIRTERHGSCGKATRFPHIILPRHELTSMTQTAFNLLMDDRLGKGEISNYHLVINSSLMVYRWHAVVSLTRDQLSHREFELAGEVFDPGCHTDCMLRDGMRQLSRVYSVEDRKRCSTDVRYGLEAVRRMLLSACCTDKWMEVSCTREEGIVFWGMR